MTALADAEQRARDDTEKPARLTKEDVQRADRRGLIDEGSLDVFVTWWQFGGMEKGLSLIEIVQMPAALRSDMLYLLGELGKIRKGRRKAKEGIGRSKK